MRLIDADELMNDMLHITTIDGNIPLKVVIAAIWEAPTAKRTGWISAKDRLPEDGQLVVVRHEVKGRIYSEVAYYIMNLWWLDWDSNGLELNAISWIPLPEPQEED